MDSEEGEVAKKVLDNLRGYLQENLHVDVNFVVELEERGLLLEQNAYRIRSTVETKESKDGVNELLDYMSSFYDEEMLETFCDFLEEYSKSTDPSLLTIANKIGEEMIKQQVHPMGLTGSQQSDPSGPRESAPMFHAKSFMDKYKERFLRCVYTLSIATRLKVDHVIPEVLYHEIDWGKITASEASEKLFLHLRSHAVPDTIHHLCDVMAGQEDYPLMKKLGEDMKKDKDLPPSSTGPLSMESSTTHPPETTRDDVPGPSGTDPPAVEPSPPNTASEPEPGDIFYPVITELDGDFSDLATEVLEQIKTLDTGKLARLRIFLANLLKPKVPPSSPPPYVPVEYGELESFLISRWDPLQIRVLKEIVKKHIGSLSEQLKAYEKLLKRKIPAFLSECKTKKVQYKRLHRYSTVAVTIDCTPSEVSLSRILELKEFFVRQLGIREELFKGFRKSSTILYFSIPKDSEWCLTLCLHPPNLRQLKEWQVTSLSVEGKFTVDTVFNIVDIFYEESLSKHKYMIDAMISDPFKLRVMMQSAAKHKHRDEELMSEVTQLREKVAEKDEELQQSVAEHNYRNEELMSEISQMREKMAEMEKSLMYYEEGRFVEGKILSPSQAPETKVKLETSFAMTSPHFEHKFKTEPLAKKPKLGESDYEEMKPKLEHELKLETFHSKEEPEPELGKVHTKLEHESKLEKEDSKLMHESKLEKEDPKLEHESKLEKEDSKLMHESELEKEDPKLGHESKLEKGDPKLGHESESKVNVEEEGKLTSSEEVQQETIQMLREFEETIHKLRLFEEEKLKLSHLYWREEPDVLEGMGWPTAVYLNGKIFIGDRVNYQKPLCVFDVVSRTWSKLPFHDSCEMYGFTLATSNSKVHTLGGTWRKDGKVERYSNKVFSLDDDLKWCNTLPPLNIGREQATSTSFDSFILVAGGVGRNGLLSSVEVLNSSQSSSTWWEICDLPVKFRLMQCTVTHDELFIGCGAGGTEYTVYTTKLSAVKESLNVDEDSESSVSPESFWQPLPQTPLRWSGLVSVNNCLLTVGGCDDDPKPHSSVHLYDCYKKTWSKVSDIRKSRYSPAVVVSTFENKQELFVLGGWGADTSVESCELL